MTTTWAIDLIVGMFGENYRWGIVYATRQEARDTLHRLLVNGWLRTDIGQPVSGKVHQIG